MRVRRLIAAAICAAALMTGPPSAVQAASGEAYLAVLKEKQKEDNWCWAAGTRSAINFLFGITASQCTLANKMFNRNDCCNPDVCDKPETLWAVRNMLLWKFNPPIGSDYGLTFNWTDTKNEIGMHRRPILARVGWNGYKTGHMFVLRAYQWHDSGDKSIGVMDPGDALYKWYTWPYFTSNSVFTWTDSLWKIHR